MIHDPEPGLNHITYNELKILNTKTTLHVSQMIEKPEVLKIKKKMILFHCLTRAGPLDLAVFPQTDTHTTFGCGQPPLGRPCPDPQGHPSQHDPGNAEFHSPTKES